MRTEAEIRQRLEEIHELAKSVDLDAEDAADKIAELDREAEKLLDELKAHKQRERLLNLVDEASQAEQPDEDGGRVVSASEALWANGALRREVSSGKGLNFGAAFKTRSLVAIPADGEGLLQIQEPVSARRQMPRIRDAIGVIDFEQGVRAVEYIREASYNVSAGVVAEGAAKPESDMSLERVVETAKVIAHHIPVTRQALSNRQGLQRHVEGRLMDGLLKVEDEKLIQGTGGGSDIRGLLNEPGVLSYAAAGTDNVADALVSASMRIIEATEGFFMPTAVVIHVRDFERLAKTKDSNGQYVFPELFRTSLDRGALPFVGVRPIVSLAVPQGTAVVGAFGLANALYQVPEGTIRATDSHSDEFTKNIVRILAEIQIAHAIEIPAGFCKVTLP